MAYHIYTNFVFESKSLDTASFGLLSADVFEKENLWVNGKKLIHCTYWVPNEGEILKCDRLFVQPILRSILYLAHNLHKWNKENILICIFIIRSLFLFSFPLPQFYLSPTSQLYKSWGTDIFILHQFVGKMYSKIFLFNCQVLFYL